MPVAGSLTIMSTHARDRAIDISSADRLASSIASPPDGVCEISLRSCRVGVKGTEIVGELFGLLAASSKSPDRSVIVI